MITLKSRAKTCAINLYLNPETYNEDKADGYKEGYIDGATDQRKIDIDKACKWIEQYTGNYCNEDTCACVNDFRKAMEKGL